MTAVVGVDLGGTNLRVAAVVDGAITASARRVLGDRRGVADVLAAIANRLRQHVRDSDTVARVGGDEFLYLLVDPQGPTNVERIAAQIVAYLAAPIAVDDLALVVRPSIGIALHPEHGATGPELIAAADRAMYRAKRESLGHVVADLT